MSLLSQTHHLLLIVTTVFTMLLPHSYTVTLTIITMIAIIMNMKVMIKKKRF